YVVLELRGVDRPPNYARSLPQPVFQGRKVHGVPRHEAPLPLPTDKECTVPIWKPLPPDVAMYGAVKQRNDTATNLTNLVIAQTLGCRSGLGLAPGRD